MYRTWLEIGLIIIIVCLGIYCFHLRRQIPKQPKIEIIDSINARIDTIYIINDSLLNSINNSKDVVKRIDDDYKNDYIRIVNESSYNDVLFFTNYLKEQAKRGLFNSDYLDSIKAN